MYIVKFYKVYDFTNLGSEGVRTLIFFDWWVFFILLSLWSRFSAMNIVPAVKNLW